MDVNRVNEITPLSLEEIKVLGRPAQVALAARCALRILPFGKGVSTDDLKGESIRKADKVIWWAVACACYLDLADYSPGSEPDMDMRDISPEMASMLLAFYTVKQAREDYRNELSDADVDIDTTAETVYDGIQLSIAIATADSNAVGIAILKLLRRNADESGWETHPQLADSIAQRAIIHAAVRDDYQVLLSYEGRLVPEEFFIRPLWHPSLALPEIDSILRQWKEALGSLDCMDIWQRYTALFHGKRIPWQEIEAQFPRLTDIRKRINGESGTPANRIVDPSFIHFAEHGVLDAPSPVDAFGFQPYVKAMADFIQHEQTGAPLTISIEAPWGSGKTSFMLQLQKELDPQKCKSVWFSPWRHEKNEALWAAFALCLAQKLKTVKDWRWWRSRKTNGESNSWFEALRQYARDWWRIKLATIKYDCSRVKNTFLDYLLSKLILATVFGMLLVGVAIGLMFNFLQIDPLNWAPPFSHTTLLTGGLSILTVFCYAFHKVKELVGNPFNFDFKAHFKDLNYEEQVGFCEKFHEDFRSFVNAYRGQSKVVVFIDDLDRCEVPKAAELIQGLNLLMDDRTPIVFIMGIDRKKVAAGIAAKFKDLIPYLHEESDAKASPEPYRELAFGYNYLEKFIQIPFRLPSIQYATVDQFLGRMLGEGSGRELRSKPVSEGETAPASSSSSDQSRLSSLDPSLQLPKQVPSESGKSSAPSPTPHAPPVPTSPLPEDIDDRDTLKSLLEMVAPALGYNPRRYTQFINNFRLNARIMHQLGLLYAGNEENKPFDNHVRKWTYEQLAKVEAISLMWPLMLDEAARTRIGTYDLFSSLIADESMDKPETKTQWHGIRELRKLLRFDAPQSKARMNMSYLNLSVRYSIYKG